MENGLLNKETLLSFCREFDYPDEAVAALSKAFDCIAADTDARGIFARILSSYEEGRSDVPFRTIAEQTDRAGRYACVPVETANLVLLILMSRHAQVLFKAAGMDETMFHESFLDLRYKLFECQKMRGVWGNFVFSWNARWYDASRVALGRLQFEIGPAPCVIQAAGRVIERGYPLINVHIPSNGRLTPEAVQDSYQRAVAFFTPRLPGKEILFRCSSWLLFRRHAELLGENANITRFAAAYHLYDWGNYASAAASDLWRIFYRDAGKAPAELPRRTSLERAYAGLLLRGELPGFGAGILPADEIG